MTEAMLDYYKNVVYHGKTKAQVIKSREIIRDAMQWVSDPEVKADIDLTLAQIDEYINLTFTGGEND